MSSETPDAATNAPVSSTSSGHGNKDTGDFECNICFELAQDPIVTLCGHLFCWPCLYRWLRFHSKSHECPVCKALIEESKLVPLYGRGKTASDPRSKPIPGLEIPNRPAAQRPETAPPPVAGSFPDISAAFVGNLFPMASAMLGSFAVSAGFVGFFPILGIRYGGFPVGTGLGDSNAYFGETSTAQVHRTRHTNQEDGDSQLKFILLLILFVVLLAILI